MDGQRLRSSGCAAAIASIAIVAVVALTTTTHASSAGLQDPATDKGAEAFTAVARSVIRPIGLSPRAAQTQWEEVLDKMTKLGAQITDDNYDTLIDYLLRNYGKINVNRGESKDIALVASL